MLHFIHCLTLPFWSPVPASTAAQRQLEKPKPPWRAAVTFHQIQQAIGHNTSQRHQQAGAVRSTVRQ
jgi:hypothetical protein